jgi:rRNA maturation RNase YbeY
MILKCPSFNSFRKKSVSKLPHPRKTSTWLLNTIKSEENTTTGINFIFCSDKYLKAINVEYLSHDTSTDIITFDYTNDEGVAGDVCISIDRVRENASKFHTNLDEELHRVMIHGVLHLLGYKDKSKRAKSLMRKKEDAYLSLRS